VRVGRLPSPSTFFFFFFSFFHLSSSLFPLFEKMENLHCSAFLSFLSLFLLFSFPLLLFRRKKPLIGKDLLFSPPPPSSLFFPLLSLLPHLFQEKDDHVVLQGMRDLPFPISSFPFLLYSFPSSSSNLHPFP